MKLAITGVGMMTAVGRDADQSCASIRAGITRPKQIDYFTIVDESTEDLIPLVGHPVHGYTEGFFLVARWIRLGQGCLTDLLYRAFGQINRDRAFWDHTSIIVVVPNLNGDRFQSRDSGATERIKEVFIKPLLELCDVPFLIDRAYVIEMGNAGCASAVQYAENLLSARDQERVIVLSVDSYLDTLTLEWLERNGRVKTASNPVGLSPGEAGACFVIESTASHIRQKLPVLAFIDGIGLAKDDLLSEGRSIGAGLAKAMEMALCLSQLKEMWRGDVLADLNGENWKALEMASAMIMLSKKFQLESSIFSLSSSLGEVGAANGVLSVCVATHSFLRGYSSTGHSLVTNISEAGDIGVVSLCSS